jgi:hypothetical protein
VSLAVAGVATAASAAWVALQLVLQAEQQRRAAAYEFLRQLNARELVGIRSIVLKSDTAGRSAPITFEEIGVGRRRRARVTQLLGVFEDIAVAIREGYADEDVLYRAIGPTVCFLRERMRPFIDGVREERRRLGDEGSASYYSELDALADAWGKGAALTNGRKLSPTSR